MAEPIEALKELATAQETPLRALRRTLAPALVDLVRRGETALAPGVRLEDVSFYLDPAQFEREHRDRKSVV